MVRIHNIRDLKEEEIILRDKVNYEKKVKKRKDALGRRNAVEYIALCNDQGLEPEDEFLGEQAEAEVIYFERKKASQELSAARDLYKRRLSRGFLPRENQRMYKTMLTRVYGLNKITLAGVERDVETLSGPELSAWVKSYVPEAKETSEKDFD